MNNINIYSTTFIFNETSDTIFKEDGNFFPDLYTLPVEDNNSIIIKNGVKGKKCKLSHLICCLNTKHKKRNVNKKINNK